QARERRRRHHRAQGRRRRPGDGGGHRRSRLRGGLARASGGPVAAGEKVMRIACLYLPGFLLQVHARAAAFLVGTSFAVVGTRERDVPRVLAASRRALDAGVRPGMTVTQARAVSADVRLVDATPAEYLEARHALGEAALGLSVTVDIE